MISEKDRLIIKTIGQASFDIEDKDNESARLVKICQDVESKAELMFIMPAVADVFMQIIRCIAVDIDYDQISKIVRSNVAPGIRKVMRDTDHDGFTETIKTCASLLFTEDSYDSAFQICCEGLSESFGLDKVVPMLGALSSLKINEGIESGELSGDDISNMRYELLSFFTTIVNADKLMELNEFYSDPALQINLMTNVTIVAGNHGLVDYSDYEPFMKKYYELGSGILNKDIEGYSDVAQEFINKIGNKLD